MIDNMDFAVFKYVSGKENLSPIFDIKLNTFESVSKPTVTDSITLYDLLMQIKYNFLNGMTIDEYLTPKYVNGNPNKVFAEIKKKKRTVCYNATFKEYKDGKHQGEVTNLMFLDIDHFKSKNEALEYKEMIIKKYDWIVACNLSLSRIGLHVIILVDKITDNEDYNKKYDFINSFYFDGNLDKGAKSLTRHSIIPHDSQIFINENPKELLIDSIIKELKPFLQPVNLNLSNQSVSSKEEVNPNKQKSTEGGIKKEKVISSPRTFSLNPNIEKLTSESARNYGLLFEEVIDENMFDDPDTPLHYLNGIHVIELNLYPYKNEKVQIGNRNNTIGAISACLIYLNSNRLKDKPDNKKKTDIMKFMQHFNIQFCEVPLTPEEVRNSVDGNWKNYVNGLLNVDRYFKLRYTLWSKHSTLTSNEKRSVTGKIKSEPIVAESRKKISGAIEALHLAGEKITQEKVITDYKIGSTTVKKYWREFKPKVIELNQMKKY